MIPQDSQRSTALMDQSDCTCGDFETLICKSMSLLCVPSINRLYAIVSNSLHACARS